MAQEPANLGQRNTPLVTEVCEGEITVTDATHPLFGRVLKLSGLAYLPGHVRHCQVEILPDQFCYIPVASTDLAAVPRPLPTLLTVAAVEELVTTFQAMGVAKRSPMPTIASREIWMLLPNHERAAVVEAVARILTEEVDNERFDQDTLKACTVCDLFLDYSQKHHVEHTYQGYKDFLQDFCEMYGTMLGKDLRPLHVTRWLDAHPGWKSSRRNAIISIKRAFNWADAEGLLQPNPIKAVKKPPQRHRDRILTPQEREEILGAIKDRHFREFVFAMMETGARPGEVRKVTAAHVNLDLGVWIFKEHKTAKRTHKQRIIYLNESMIELTRKLVAMYPEGPLFRGPRSKRGNTRNGIRCRFRRLREKLPHLAGVVSYCMRHSFATNALVNGVGIAQVAELLGHVDTSMVSAHYAHLASNVQHMREMANKATGG